MPAQWCIHMVIWRRLCIDPGNTQLQQIATTNPYKTVDLSYSTNDGTLQSLDSIWLTNDDDNVDDNFVKYSVYPVGCLHGLHAGNIWASMWGGQYRRVSLVMTSISHTNFRVSTIQHGGPASPWQCNGECNAMIHSSHWPCATVMTAGIGAPGSFWTASSCSEIPAVTAHDQ